VVCGGGDGEGGGGVSGGRARTLAQMQWRCAAHVHAPATFTPRSGTHRGALQRLLHARGELVKRLVVELDRAVVAQVLGLAHVARQLGQGGEGDLLLDRPLWTDVHAAGVLDLLRWWGSADDRGKRKGVSGQHQRQCTQ